MTDIKFCGLTRPEDAGVAASLGASYVGVIFAGGPRQVTPDRARKILDGARLAAAPAGPRRVGVFGAHAVNEIITTARDAQLEVVQLHSHSDSGMVAALRTNFTGEVWRVVRLSSTATVHDVRQARDGVDALLFDALVPGALGGTGHTVDWRQLSALLAEADRAVRVVLAGGLNADNVQQAIGLVTPQVVDVSSGVESSVGVKDHAKMCAFAAAVARGGV